jgi:hypothetical protein
VNLVRSNPPSTARIVKNFASVSVRLTPALGAGSVRFGVGPGSDEYTTCQPQLEPKTTTTGLTPAADEFMPQRQTLDDGCVISLMGDEEKRHAR